MRTSGSPPGAARYISVIVLAPLKQSQRTDELRNAVSTSRLARLTYRTHTADDKWRVTYAHSKKWDHLHAALALHFAYYNFCRVHRSLRVTPAMEVEITTIRTLRDLLKGPESPKERMRPIQPGPNMIRVQVNFSRLGRPANRRWLKAAVKECASAPEELRVLLSGVGHIDVSAETADDIRKWAECLDGWAEARERDRFLRFHGPEHLAFLRYH